MLCNRAVELLSIYGFVFVDSQSNKSPALTFDSLDSDKHRSTFYLCNINLFDIVHEWDDFFLWSLRKVLSEDQISLFLGLSYLVEPYEIVNILL
jgi:hypothetical protein